MPLASRSLALGVVLLAVIARADTPTGKPAPPMTADERLLQAAYLDHTGPTLLSFFRRQSEAQVDPKELQALIAELGKALPSLHRPAAGKLIALGAPAAPALREVANNLDDTEAAERARVCLSYIEGPSASVLASTMVRQLAIRRPPETAAALLAYLPFAPDDNVVRDVENALAAVAHVDGQLDPSLAQALRDPHPVRRSTAATVICRVGRPSERELVRPLLKDPRPVVRMRAAFGLAAHDDPETIPLLIDLLAELPSTQRMEVERFLAGLAGVSLFVVRPGVAPPSGQVRREIWAAWWQSMNGESLLEEFRSRALGDADREKALQWLRQLGSADLAVRDRATAELQLLGGRIAPLLRQAARASDPSVRGSAASCLQLLERDGPAPLPAAAVRLLVLRQPPGAVDTLLAYLPFADSPELAKSVESALGKLAFRDGKVQPALLQALESAVPVRRVVAAELLCRSGPKELRDKTRKLLADPDLPTRLRFALFLLAQHDRAAVPVLIALLAELPPELAVEAEEMLRFVAGSRAVAVHLQDGAKQCRDAWQTWWRKYGDAVDLAKVFDAGGTRGPTLLMERITPGRITERLLMIDPNGQVLWQMEPGTQAYDAQPISAERILITELSSRQLTERDSRGNILWKHDFSRTAYSPISAKRLANGNTFVVCRNHLLELDPKGKEVFNIPLSGNMITAARKWPNGDITYLTSAGLFTRLDSKGKAVKAFSIPTAQRGATYVEILPNDRVLVSEFDQGYRLVEYDSRGQELRHISLPTFVSSFQRLANGSTLLVTSSSQILEVDRTGKTVWELKAPNLRPHRARRLEPTSN